MEFGFVIPFGGAQTIANLAVDAESAGWDAIFLPELLWGIDPWVSLTAAAMRTERIRLGTMLSPLPVLRPWKLASESATLDNLSKGRVILSVGLGAVDAGMKEFGIVTDRKVRAEILDEALEIISKLWSAKSFNFKGKHFNIAEQTFFVPPPPLQKPRIPIWVVGAFQFGKSLSRALKFDGLIPTTVQGKRARAPSEKELKDALIKLEFILPLRFEQRL